MFLYVQHCVAYSGRQFNRTSEVSAETVQRMVGTIDIPATGTPVYDWLADGSAQYHAATIYPI